MVANETGNILPNYRSEEWRDEQKEHFLTIFKGMLAKYGSRIGESISVKSIDEWYDPTIENAYVLPVEAISDNIPVYKIIWNPLTRKLTWCIVLVLKKGHGIGTALKEMTEELAFSLNASRLVCQGVLDQHLDFWRRQG